MFCLLCCVCLLFSVFSFVCVFFVCLLNLCARLVIEGCVCRLRVCLLVRVFCLVSFVCAFECV